MHTIRSSHPAPLRRPRHRLVALATAPLLAALVAGCMDAAVTAAAAGAASAKAGQEAKTPLDAARGAASTLATHRPVDPDQ